MRKRKGSGNSSGVLDTCWLAGDEARAGGQWLHTRQVSLIDLSLEEGGWLLLVDACVALERFQVSWSPKKTASWVRFAKDPFIAQAQIRAPF